MIEWQGTKELNNALKRIVREFPRARDLFLRQEAELLTARVKPKTPADSGRLRGAWARSEPSGGSIEVYNNTEYAPYVEFGHRTRNGKSVVPGQFFLRDAVDESRAQFQADASRILARLFR
ncbi:MAG: HK97 gp10 family phage protein [Selenomonadaceae bacterium]|nr:HK97 gp10 family phage protein [Selenomonadaceae bacterium]